MTDEIDDIPPLEDIPVETITGNKTQTSTPIVKYVQSETKPQNEIKVEPVQQQKDKCFAGMKKGFLNSSSTPKTNSNEIIEIKRPSSEKTKDFRVFDEVQQKMKEEQKSREAWLTDDLLKQIEDDESLAKGFSDPYFMQAIELFQKSPQEALAKYGNNPEVMQFFQRMSKILGKHFVEIKKEDEKPNVSPIVDPEVNKILQDESIRQLLMDPEILQLMKLLREEPEKAQRMMRTANMGLRQKIQRLVDCGLLSVA